MDPRRFVLNPFYVLELRPGCKRVDVERQGQTLLSKIEVGVDIGPYVTPLGPFPRDADMVAQAIDLLRDPEQRPFHEFWAALPAEPLPTPPPSRMDPWTDALDSFGI